VKKRGFLVFFLKIYQKKSKYLDLDLSSSSSSPKSNIKNNAL